MGECIFGLGGPFLFTRFGLNIPWAAAAGSSIGAALGYGAADTWVRIKGKWGKVPPVGETAQSEAVAVRKGIAEAGPVRNFEGPNPTRDRIEEGLSRIADWRSGEIRVEVHDRKVVLKGKVRSWAQEAEAERIAFDMPGIQEVDNRLQVVS